VKDALSFDDDDDDDDSYKTVSIRMCKFVE